MAHFKRLFTALVAAGVLAAASAMAAEREGLLLLANLEKPVELNRQQVRNLFMGGRIGIALKPVALSNKHRDRLVFNTRVIGLTESRINSYWAQMRFTGRGKPPQEFDSTSAMIEYLRTHPGAVGYVPANTQVPAELSVLFRLEK